MTQRTFDSFCRSCSSSVTLISSILLTVVTAYGSNQLGLDNNMWPIFVTQMHTNPGRLNCTNCNTQTCEPVLRNVLNSRFLFIEFSRALMNDINVFEDIEISGAQYKLRGPVCNNKDCRKKIRENPGSKIVRCLHCNRAMLLKNCYIEMNINFHLEKQDQHFSVTAFPKIVGNFLQEDIFQYKDNIDDLTEKLL